MTNELAALSNDLAAAVERAGKSVVAVHARPRFSSAGVIWQRYKKTDAWLSLPGESAWPTPKSVYCESGSATLGAPRNSRTSVGACQTWASGAGASTCRTRLTAK